VEGAAELTAALGDILDRISDVLDELPTTTADN
jgi:hypothetical protein